jgi:ubiquinone biosynthesis protein
MKTSTASPWLQEESQIDVEECLKRFDLIDGVPADFPPQSGDSERRSRRIRMALRELGPVFVLFGRYLSTRNDLLPAVDCLELASLPDVAESMAAADVEELITEQLGGPSGETFLYFDPQPLVSRVVSQSHTALLPDGSTVTVTLVRPDFREHFERDLRLVHLLRPAFSCTEWSGFNLENEIVAFARCVRSQIDFCQQADFIEALALDASDSDLLQVPDLHRAFCRSAILTVGRNFGSPLCDVLDHIQHLSPPDRYAMSRRLWLVWLRQVLFGRVFPIEPRPAAIAVFPSGQVGFEPGPCCRGASDSKRALLEYLIAVIGENPDQAFCALLQQVTPAQNSDPRALRNSFRQATSFGPGEWQLGSRAHGLAQRLLLQWRLLHEHGYQLQNHLASFYRGLFLMSSCCGRFEAAGDPLQDAAEELRVMAVFDRIRELPPFHDWKGDFSRYAGLMMELPDRLDQLLSVAADGKPVLHVKFVEPPEKRRHLDLAMLMTAVCVVFVTLPLFDPGLIRLLNNASGTKRGLIVAFWLVFILALRWGR